ncbi:MAG: hypothetical protein AB8C40_00975 [Gammaproteobacteria bacterium]
MPIESRMVKKTLDPLFGKEIDLKDAKPLDTSNKVVIGTYVNGEGQTTGAIVMDYSCACYTAAALSMMPADIAEENIKSGEIEESLRDNLYEVLNIGVSFFSDGTTPDMRIKEMLVGPTEIPGDIQNVFKNAYTDLHVEMDIPGYGSGSSSMYLV